jgi:hypothetical protein
MRNTMLLALALGEVDFPTTHTPFICHADDDGYATEGEVGYYDGAGRWVPVDYQTVGDGYNTGAAQQLQLARPLARAAPARGPVAQQRIQPRPAPRAAPQQGGLTAGQVQQIIAQNTMSPAAIRALIEQLMAAHAPYGTIPSRVSPDEALFPMGLGFVIMSGGPPAVLGPVQFNNNGQGILPQRAFRGERLVLSTFRSSGASTVPVIVDTFKVGDYSQLVGGAPVPVETFAPDAFGVRLMLDGAVPGVTYTLSVSVPAAVGIPAGETITVVGAVLGRTGEAPQR